MVPTTPSVDKLRSVFSAEPELLLVVLNASSPAEVNLALDILRDKAPERSLVAAVNLREVLLELPKFPCSMPLDDVTLARIAGFHKDRLAWYKPLDDGLGLTMTTAGNYCFDLIVHDAGKAVYVTPIPADCGVVNPGFIEAIMRHDGLLATVVELVMDMGMVFSPQPYMSLEDWSLDHAQEVMADAIEFF